MDCNERGINEICTAADNFCLAQVENLYDIYLGRDEYDFRYLMPDPFPPTYYVDYLNSAPVQAAIGAYVNFTESNSAVGSAFGTTGDDDREIGTVEALKKLLAQGIKVVMYFGDADYNCNWLGGQVVAEHVNAPGYAGAGFVNISSSDGVVHGQVRQSGKFAFVRIYESGHEVPFYQPLVSLELLNRTMHAVDIATGKTKVGSGYKTSGPKVSTYQEGNATVQFEVVPEDAVYNVTTAMPQNGTTTKTGSGRGEKRKQKQKQKTRRKRTKRDFMTVKGGRWVLMDEQ